MNHAGHQSARAPVPARRQSAPGPAPISLDPDALNPQAWLSRRGRRLLDPSGIFLSILISWLAQPSAKRGLPGDGQIGWVT